MINICQIRYITEVIYPVVKLHAVLLMIYWAKDFSLYTVVVHVRLSNTNRILSFHPKKKNIYDSSGLVFIILIITLKNNNKFNITDITYKTMFYFCIDYQMIIIFVIK